MNRTGKVTFGGGIVFAVIAAFVPWGVLPWVVAGLGIVFGVSSLMDIDRKMLLLFLTGLVVALISIQAQFYNPQWLTDIVFFVKVFLSHALLIVGILVLVKFVFDPDT